MTRFVRKATLCSTLAIATALVVGARPASAQSFVGTVISEVGAHAHDNGNGGPTIINVTQSQAVINWQATGASNGGVITFQPQGTTAQFQGNNTFAVLNRIYPGVNGSSILLDGIISTSVNGNSGGGTIFFYSPNGVIIGQHAVIDVGSLGLTTLEIADDGNGNWLSGFGSGTKTIDFGPALNANGFVRIDNGASVRAGGPGSYIALVAPKVDLEGTINTDGVAALVAAEDATMTIRDNGLWDIQVDTGTTDPNGVVVNGTIARTTAAVGGNHTAYLVAVSKNDAMTMLFNGSSHLGFDVAGSAGVEGNSVVLSAGGGVTNGVANTPQAGGVSYMVLDGTAVTSKLFATANGINVGGYSGAASFSDDASFVAPYVHIAAFYNDVTFSKKLTVNADSHAATGANATGGAIYLVAKNGHTLQLNGLTNLSATGYGGSAIASGIAAGTGTGGQITLQADNGGHLNFSGTVFAEASGVGGDNFGGNGSGGSGTGGQVALEATGFNSQVNVGNFAKLFAEGYGGNSSACSSCNVIGGAGRGGVVIVAGDSGGSGNSITINKLRMFAQGAGGNGDVGGGTGTGGQSIVSVPNGTTLTVANEFLLFADGFGGVGTGSGSGGAGFGGNARVFSEGYGAAGGTIQYNGTGNSYFYVTAEGYGGAAGPSGANGGDAVGGNASISSSALHSVAQLYVSSRALGGGAVAGTGGNAFGGSATIYGGPGAISSTDGAIIRSYGIGGNGLSGGNGRGGTSSVTLGGGSLTTGGTFSFEAYGSGGSASGAGGIGGSGTGGAALLYGTAGTGTFSSLAMNANGLGGAAALGTGGSGVGGTSIVNTDGANYLVNANLLLNAKSTGGAGVNGGNAVAFLGTNPKNTATTYAKVLGSNATFTVNGATTLDVSATGGAASAGGRGGDAGGGYATVFAKSSDAGRMNINMGALTVRADASGGMGGNAPVESGTNGGAGGDASGGNVVVTASAGNGHLSIGNAVLSAVATGGAGGDADYGNTTGGSGGNAFITGRRGARVFFGTENGANTAILRNDGTANFTSVTANASVAGGAGGNAWSGTGGTGGNATGVDTLGGGVAISNLGGTLTTGNIEGIANATGGNSGYGYGNVRNGIGGNAIAGGLSLQSSSRAGDSTMRGTINAGNVNLHGTATGGAGAAQGTGYAGKWSAFIVDHADVNMNSFALTYAGSSGGNPDAFVDQYEILSGTVSVATSFAVIDPTKVSFYIDNGSLNAGSFSVQAGDFIHDPLILVPPTARGTITAGAINLSSGNNIVMDANLVSTGDLDLNAYGLIDLGNLKADGYIHASAGDSITLGNVNSGSSTYLQALNSISANNVDAGGDFEVQAQLGDITLNDLNSGNYIHLRAGGDISTNDALAHGRLLFDADGTVHARNLTAGRRMSINGSLGVVLGDLSAGFGYPDIVPEQGFSVVVSAGTSIEGLSIDVGDVAAQYNIGFFTPGNLGTGTLTAGRDVLAMVGGDINTGAITAGGRIFLTDVYSFFLAGGTQDDGDNFDAALVFANDPLATGGLINIDGTVTGGSLQAAAGGNFTSGAITVGGNIYLNAGSDIVFNGASAGDSMEFKAGGSMTGGNLTAGRQITGQIQGALHLGDLSVGQDGPVGPTDKGFSVGLASATSILVGDVWGAEGIGFVSSGTLTAGTLTAGSDVGLLVHGDMILDAISAGTNGRIYLADSIMFANAGGANDFHPEQVFGAEPVRTSGSITVTGAISGGSLQAKAGNNFTSGAIGIGSLASIDAGGNVLLAGVDAGGDLRIVAGGTVSTDNLDAGESIGIDAGGAVTALNLTAGDTIAVLSGGAISLGNLSAGLIDPSTAAGAEYNIGLNAHGTLTTGTLAAFNSIGLAATGNISTQSINAGDIFLALGGGDMSFGPLTAGGTAYLANYSMMTLGGTLAGNFDAQPILDAAPVASGGSILINGAIDVGSLIANAGTSFGAGDIGATDAMQVLAGTSISADAIDVGAALELSAGDVNHTTTGSILTGDILAGGSIAIGAGQSIHAGDLSAGNGVTLLSGGNIDVGNVSAGVPQFFAFTPSFEGAAYDIAINSGGAVSTGDLTASHDVLLAATGTLDTTAIDAGHAVVALSDGAMHLGPVNALALFYVGGTGIMVSAGQIGSDFSLAGLVLGQTNASGGTVTINGAVSAGSMSAYSTGNFTAGDITTTGETFAGSLASVQLDDMTAGGNVQIAANGGTATTGAINSGQNIGIHASTTIGTGVLDAGWGINLDAGTGITVAGAINAGGNVDMLATSGPISAQAIRAGQTVDLETAGTVNGTTISAGESISVWGSAGVTLTNLDAGIVSPYFSEGPGEYHIGIGSDHDVTVGNLHAAGDVGLAAGGNLVTQAIQSGGDVLAMVGGNAGFGAITAVGRFAITGYDMIAAAGGREDFDRQFVFDAIDAETATRSGGSVNLTGPVSAYRVDALVGQNLNAGAMTANHNVEINAGGTLTVGDVTTGHKIGLIAEGAMITGNLSAGLVNPLTEVEEHEVGLLSRTSIHTGNIASAGFVGMASAGSVLTGNIDAGGDVIALAGTTAQFGAITTNSEGYLLIAGFDTLNSAGGYDHPDNALLIAAVDGGYAVATGGSVTITGPVSSHRIDVLAGGNFTSGDIASDDMLARVGGTAILNGQWANGKTSLHSNDIAIGAEGGISGDEIVLISTNATQTMVGGGLSGTGYLLDGAEFGRLSAPSLTIIGTADASAAIDMLIGDLGLSGSEGAKQYTFVSGRMRVVGNVIGTNFTSANTVNFNAGLVEVDAANATIALGGAGTPLGGVLNFDTPNLHVAEVALLDKLAADPNFANRDLELQTAPATARPDGVVRANEINVILGSGASLTSAAVTTATTVPYTVFVQNTGTLDLRAGFLAASTNIVAPGGMAPGSIDLIVNGQLTAEGGNLTGDKVRDALIGEGDSPKYTSNSSINGCPVSGGVCVNIVPPPPIPHYDPAPPLASEFVLISAPTADDLPFGNEESIEDNKENGGDDSASSPIVPPQPLFDTRPMETDDETDEPISGGGNPALIGAGVNPPAGAN